MLPAGSSSLVHSRRLIFTAVPVLVAAAALAVVGLGRGGATPAASSSAAAPISALAGAQALGVQFERVVNAVEPSVVQIQGRRGLGSGVVYDATGTSSPTRTWSATRRRSR